MSRLRATFPSITEVVLTSLLITLLSEELQTNGFKHHVSKFRFCSHKNIFFFSPLTTFLRWKLWILFSVYTLSWIVFVHHVTEMSQLLSGWSFSFPIIECDDMLSEKSGVSWRLIFDKMQKARRHFLSMGRMTGWAIITSDNFD